MSKTPTPSPASSPRRLFVTEIYQASLTDLPDWRDLNTDLEQSALMLAEDDEAGQAWCEENGYDGYTSYSSLDDLPRRATCFATLARKLQGHADTFAGHLQWDLRGRKLALDNIWVNVLAPGGSHTGHVHPHCVLSGTYYVALPKGASAIRFEDPRLAMMMAAPTPAEDCDPDRRRFVSVAPTVGDLLMWESWLRHEVPPNRSRRPRVSVSFNYRLA
ncbi:MAG: TIGR02466 family protein [Hyphomonadaceae bacterium]